MPTTFMYTVHIDMTVLLCGDNAIWCTVIHRYAGHEYESEIGGFTSISLKKQEIGSSHGIMATEYCTSRKGHDSTKLKHCHIDCAERHHQNIGLPDISLFYSK